MMHLLLSLMLVAGPTETERTLPVQEGTRLEVSNHAGEVVVRGWDRNEVKILADHGSRDEVDVDEGRSSLRIKAQSTRGRPAIVDYQISVPKWMSVEVVGPYCDMDVQEVDGDIYLETVEGEITVSGGSGHVTLRSVEGDVRLRHAKGRMEVISVDGDIWIAESSGAIVAEAVDGTVVLENITSNDVDANSVDGDVVYEGTVDDEGQYRLMTHDGDVQVLIPEDSNVSITVATVEGDFESCFRVEPNKRSKRSRFKLELGTGDARMELETFDGDVVLCHPGR